MTIFLDQIPTWQCIKRLRNAAKQADIPVLIEHNGRTVTLGGDRKKAEAILTRLSMGGI